jgi:hypothetical protein
MAQFYSYITDTPNTPGLTDEGVGTEQRFIVRDLKTVRGVVNRVQRARPGKSFKVFTFTNFYDDKTFRLVHTYLA